MTDNVLWSNERIADKLLTLVEDGMDVDSAAGKLVRELRDDLTAQIAQLTAAKARLVSEAGEWEVVEDGKLDKLGTILRNRTIFIPCSLAKHILHGYTLGDDEMLVRRTSKEGTNDG